MTLDKDLGIATLSNAIEKISTAITEYNGKISVKMQPKAVSVKEESDLQAMMDRLAAENAEKDGDDDDDSDDDDDDDDGPPETAPTSGGDPAAP